MPDPQPFLTLKKVAEHLRAVLEEKKYILIFAHNGTGKTRLSMEFKELGKNTVTSPLVTDNQTPLFDEEDNRLVVTETVRDTLYYNAFTEDLFIWNNDLDGDSARELQMNTASRFFNGLVELEMESRIKRLLRSYLDIDFTIDYENGTISFARTEKLIDENGNERWEEHDNIKISRGEESVFIWCFFLAIAQLAIDKQEAYDWVKYIYIDDPVSSLDDNHVVAIATHLAQLLKSQGNGRDQVKAVISTHHTLFFNVMSNELGKKRAIRYFLSRDRHTGEYLLQDITSDTPEFYHIAMLKDLHEVADSNEIYTYHFSILRSVLEKAATFHGFSHFGKLVKTEGDEDGILHYRLVQLLNHGNYSHFEPVLMVEENKEHFRNILRKFMEQFRYNEKIFPSANEEAQQ